MSLSQLIQIIASCFYVMFLPGFVLSFLFFKPSKIEFIERIALSFALSITITPLLSFYLNLVGVKISPTSIIIEILIFTVVVSMFLPFMYVNLRKSSPQKIRYFKYLPKILETKTSNNKSILNVHIIFRELFQISLITYLILLLLETVKVGFVSFFFNLNILLIIVIVSGIIMAITNYKDKNDRSDIWNFDLLLHQITQNRGLNNMGKLDKYFIFLLSVFGGALVYTKTQELEGISIILALSTSVIIFLLSYILFIEEN